MTQAESVLHGWQRDGLRIDNFIFHIINSTADEGEDNVIFLDEVTLTDNQRLFFLDRLKETAQGNTYTFLENATGLRNNCIELVSNPENFVKVSCEITRDFATHHGRRMSAGIFIVAEVYVPMPNQQHGKLVFLVKVDNKKTIQVNWKEVNGRKVADFEEIENALTENKQAIQKSALIDMNNLFRWDVLAFDRNSPTRLTRLGEFFENFLEVGIYGTPKSLTKKAVTTVRNWIRNIPVEELPEGLNRITARERALAYITGNEEFETNRFISNIIRDEVPERPEAVQILKNSLLDALSSDGIAGQRFIMDNSWLPQKQRETRLNTVEGIKIIAARGIEDSDIEIRWQNPASLTGPAEIIIRTQNLTFDD